MYLTKLLRTEYRLKIEELLLNISKNSDDIQPKIKDELKKLKKNYTIKASRLKDYPSGDDIVSNPTSISPQTKIEITAIIVQMIKSYMELLQENKLILFDKEKLEEWDEYGETYSELFTSIAKIRKRKPRRYFKTLGQMGYKIHDPENVDIYDPENVDIYDPENVDIYDPENVDIYDPENVDIYDPENVDIYDPENVDIYDPENVDIYDPENVDIYDPKLGTSPHKSYYRIAANIRFPNEPPGDPAPENEDIYDPFAGDIKEDLILFIENWKFLSYPNGDEIKDFHSIRDILVHLMDTYKDEVKI